MRFILFLFFKDFSGDTIIWFALCFLVHDFKQQRDETHKNSRIKISLYFYIAILRKVS